MWLILMVIAIGVAEDVWAVDDALTDQAVTSRWTDDDWRAAEKLLDDHRIELFARPSPTPGVDQRDGGRPGASPRMLEFAEEFGRHDHTVYAAIGANQCAKTTTVGGLCFCLHLRDHAKDGDVYWIVASTTDKMREIPQQTLWEFLPRSMFPAGVEYSPRQGFGAIPTLHLTLPNHRGKCEVWFRTEEMDLIVFESARLNGCWWTECKRQAIFDVIQPRLVARNGWLLMDYVPLEPWHKTRVQVHGHPDIHWQRFSMTENAHNLGPGRIDYLRRIWPAEIARVRIDGQDGGVDGVVIKEFVATAYLPADPANGGHVIPDTPIPPTDPCWVYIDVGKYTAALLLSVGADGIKRVADECYTLGLNVEENASAILAMLTRNGRAVSNIRDFKMDPAAWAYTSANEVTIGDQYIAQGIPVVGWKRTQTHAGGESAMLNLMRQEFMHRTLLVYQRCQATISELQSWRHKTDRDGVMDPKDRYTGPNHAIDGLKAWVADNPVFIDPPLTIYDAQDTY